MWAMARMVMAWLHGAGVYIGRGLGRAGAEDTLGAIWVYGYAEGA